MDNTPGLHKLRIDELILPGTHDSGSDKQAPKFILPNEVTQDEPIRVQINRGFAGSRSTGRAVCGAARRQPTPFLTVSPDLFRTDRR